MELLTVGAGVCLTVLPALGTTFLPRHHLVQPPYFVLSYHILFCPVLLCLMEACSFSEEETKGPVDLWELWGVKGEETGVWMHFNKNKIKKELEFFP